MNGSDKTCFRIIYRSTEYRISITMRRSDFKPMFSRHEPAFEPFAAESGRSVSGRAEMMIKAKIRNGASSSMFLEALWPITRYRAIR